MYEMEFFLASSEVSVPDGDVLNYNPTSGDGRTGIGSDIRDTKGKMGMWESEGKEITPSFNALSYILSPKRPHSRHDEYFHYG